MKDKKIRKRTLIILAVTAMTALGVTGAFAWFTGSVEGIGASVKTGKIRLDFDSYKYETSDSGSASLKQYIDRTIDGNSVSIDSIELASELQRSLTVLNKAGDMDTVYFVVKKKSGSIPLDVQLGFELAGLFSDQVNSIRQGQSQEIDLEYAGGFWYNLKDITEAVAQAEGSSVEKKLENYAENNQAGLSALLPDDQSHSVLRLSSITKDNTSAALQSGDYCVFRLTIGLDPNASNAVQYQDQLFDINVTLTAAQQGGLDALFGTSDIYYVSNVDELEYFMSVYKPGDSLVISKSFSYIGDLVFSRPVNITLNSNGAASTLTVRGNLIFTYPYTDSFSVNTTNGGRIVVSKYENAGGNFNIDIPSSSVSFVGTNNTAKGKADIYVAGDFSVNANCVPDSKLGKENADLLAGFGMTLNRTRIMNGDPEDQNQYLERIYLHDATMLTVSAGTGVGEIYAGTREGDVSVKQLVINNHGTVTQGVFLANMNVNQATSSEFGERGIPQIYIANYGDIESGKANSSITLPSASALFNWADHSGNTWITRELGASDGGVTNGSAFSDADIFVRYIDTYVVDVDGDGKNLRVLYTTFSNDPEAEDFGLQQIFTSRYLENPEINKATGSAADVEKLTVVTGNGKVLTADDYVFIRSMVNLKELDLSSADTQPVSSADTNAAIPANAFSGMTYLERVSLPSNAAILNANAFKGTKVLDLYLPQKMTSIKDNALTGVKYVHPLNTDAVVTNLRNGDSGRYIFVPGDLKAKYRTSYSNTNPYIFSEATLSEDGDYFYRLTSSQTAQIAVWVGTPFSTPGSSMEHFDFCDLHLDGDLYKITAYDDYAFYNKAKENTGSSTKLSVVFSDQLYEIGVSAFENGSGIGSLSFSEAAVRPCSIKNRAFLYCSSIEDLALHNVSDAGEYAFEYCSSLKTVWGNELTHAGRGAFGYCSELLAVKLPALASTTGASNDGIVFYHCPKLMAAEVGIVKASSLVYNSFSSDTSLVMMNVYTRSFAGCGISDNFYNTCGNPNTYFSMFVDSTVLSDNGSSFGSRITNAHKVDIGSFAPEDFIYYTRGDRTETSRSVISGGSKVTFGSISCGGTTYGDYIFAPNEDGNTVTLIGCLLEKISGEYTVPGEITSGGRTYTVSAIGSKAYYYTDFAENCVVTVPESITSIGSSAFYNRDGISDVVILGNDCRLGDSCFSCCDGLTDLDLRNCSSLGVSCFADCEKLETVWGSDINYAARNAFSSCGELLALRLPALTTTTGYANSSNLCASCPKLMVLELGVISGSGTIYNAVNGDSSLLLYNVHTKNFANSPINTGFYNSPGTASSYYRMHVDSVTKANDGQAFGGKITNGHRIDVMASDPGEFFYYTNSGGTGRCQEIPYTVTGADADLVTISDISCGDITYGDYVFAPNGDGETATLISCLLKEIKGEYTVPGEVTSDGKNYRVTAIGNKAFYYTAFSDYDSISCTVTVPESITSIGSSAFYDKDAITGLTILGDGCKLGENCFYDCDSLSVLDLKNCSELGSKCFSDCSGLEIVTGENVSAAGYAVFNNCANLIAVRLPRLESVGGYGDNSDVFRSCPKLMVLDIGFVSKYTGANGRGYNALNGDSSLVLYSIHTETHESAGIASNFYGQMACPSDHYRMLVDSTSRKTDSESTLYSMLPNTVKTDTGKFTAGEFFYYTRGDENEVQYKVTNEYGEYALSDISCGDITYGDYVFAHNGDGRTVTLISCLLKEVRGEYTVPGQITVGENTYTVSAIGNKAFYYTDFVSDDGASEGSSSVTIPAGITSIGNQAFSNKDEIRELAILGDGCTLGSSCFYDCDGLTMLDLANCTKLGSNCFCDCSSLVTVTGEKLSYTDYRAFYNCANLVAVRLPRLESVGGSGDNSDIFRDCPKLMVLDIGFVSKYTGSNGRGYNALNGDRSLVLYNVHTGTHENPGIASNFYSQMYCSSDHYRMLMDGVSRKTDTVTTLFSQVSCSNKTSTGSYTPDEFFYYSRNAASDRPYQVTAGGKTYELSDIRFAGDNAEQIYGDYVFAVNDEENRTVTLIACLLQSIGGSYRVPEEVEHDGVIYTVNDIWQNAYKFVSFDAGTTVVLPGGIASIGNSAFFGGKNIAQIVIENNDTYITAANIMGGDANISGALCVLVSEDAYCNIYTADATPWGGIARSHFVSSGHDFQPVDGGPVFHVDNYGGGLQVVFITNVAGGDPVITVPDSDGSREIVSMGSNTFAYMSDSNVETLVLPAGLREFSADMSLAPESLTAFEISEDADCFSCSGGMLLSKDGSMLIKVPRQTSSSAITMPEGIKVIAGGAFSSVINLSSLTVPENTSVVFTDKAFENCENLRSITFEAQEASWFTGSNTFENCSGTLKIFVPEASAELYLANAPMDGAVRSMMTPYEHSWHHCSFTEDDLTWFISADMEADSSYGTEAIAMAVCSQCGRVEYFHTDVDGCGHAEVDLDGDGIQDAGMDFLPFAVPETDPANVMCLAPEAEAEAASGESDPEAENAEETEGGEGGDNSSEGEKGEELENSPKPQNEPENKPETAPEIMIQPEPEAQEQPETELPEKPETEASETPETEVPEQSETEAPEKAEAESQLQPEPAVEITE